ncbi:DUF1993 domain-containing protein [Tahibacter soli]|uniref:DUF1993 domain-containing protein n=1 Tax=Tahibacter soli TaxID=2983605 RepID=A0A9X3YN59_9GAMM|nr:DUF1993 domain-containing protein [Tahibacter soli]MDC8015382.1 DUF1993 domain-containing protein [Tahibacter soli]
MTVSLYTASVPVFDQMLGSLGDLLGKSQAHAAEKKIEPAALLQARLFPDMFALTRQVQIACDFARGVSARLAGVDVPKTEDKETSFEELQALIAQTRAFIGSLAPAQFEGGEAREIVTRPGTPKEKRFTGSAYLLTYGLPQFFFHVTTAYALLRHNGVEIGKKDYMGLK